MGTVKEITPHPINIIVSTPGMCGGQPRIDGTRMTVKFLSMFAQKFVEGQTENQSDETWTIARICDAFDLNPAQIFAAFAYYYLHKEEIDEQIKEDEKELAEIAEQSREQVKKIKERARQHLSEPDKAG